MPKEAIQMTIPPEADPQAPRGRGKRGKDKLVVHRHGLGSVRRKIELQGLSAVDKRGPVAKELFRWRQEILRDLGGEENLSAQRLTLVDLATRTKLMIEHVDEYLLTRPSIIIRRKRILIPIVMQRMQLVDSLQRTLTTLGLDRQAKKVPSLEEYLEAKLAAHDEEPPETEKADEEKST
jgi:hypothetical protein